MFDSELLAAAALWHDAGIKLAAAFRSQRSGPVAAEVLVEVVAGVRQGELATCLAIERTDRTGEYAADGAVSTAAYLRGLANETGSWASMRVRLGRALVDRLPATRAAWEAGSLGFSHAWEIVRATKDIADADHVAVLDRIFAESTPALSPTDMKTLADRILAQEAPDQTGKKHAGQRGQQKLTLSETMNGMWDLHGRFEPEAGTLIKNVLDAFTPHQSAGEVLADPAGSMSSAQLRAQALLEMCRQAQHHAEGCNSQGGGRNTLIVAIPLHDLQTARGVGDVAGGATLPAAAMRRWACDVGIIPMVLAADSQILDYGRMTRLISRGLRSYLIARDGGCIFPGCDRPPAWTEGHHRIHVADGGPTNPENLDLLCVRHHHAVHEGGWTITISDDHQRTPWFHPPNARPKLQGQRRPLIPAPRQKTDLRQPSVRRRDPAGAVRR